MTFEKSDRYTFPKLTKFLKTFFATWLSLGENCNSFQF